MPDDDARTTWEAHYSAKPRVWSGHANIRLTEIAADLPVGRALDLGCGEGADAIWLAEQGWTVLGVDVSETALERARADADARGVGARVEFAQHDLGRDFPAGTFDLISVQFLHSPVAMDRRAILRAAADALAPGGNLLIVDHAEAPPWASKLAHHEFPSAESVLAGLALDPTQWRPIRTDRISRPAVGPDGQDVTLWDNVILVRRAGSGTGDPSLRALLARRLRRRSVVSGQFTVPAVPGMLDECVRMCTDSFEAVGVHFGDDEIGQLRAALESQLDQAFAASSRSTIVINWESGVGSTASYQIRPQWFSLDQAYDDWVATRTPPYFGTEPDARVSDLAGEAADPAAFPVLDIGAGTGRNALALARRGHPVDAVEMTPKFAEIVRAESERESLAVRVLQRDVFATMADLRRDYKLILLSEVVSDFRSAKQLAAVFELAANCLAPGGRLVFNAFLARDGYQPDAAARQLGEQIYTAIFTYPELAQASALMPLELVSDDSVYEYEQAHLPAGVWPPTGWYPDWVSGLDVFEGLPREQSPIEMRWLVYRKASWIVARSSGGASPAEW